MYSDSSAIRPEGMRDGHVVAALIALCLFPGVGSAERVISAACRFDTPLVTMRGAYAQVSADGCSTLARVGEPILPFRTVRVLLPPGSRVAAIQARTLDGVSGIHGAWTVDYGRRPVRHPAGAALEDAGPDPGIYGSLAPYPGRRAELAGVQRMGGFDIAIVRVFPVQYVPARGELLFAPRIEVSLVLQPQPIGETTGSAAPARSRTSADVSSFADHPEVLDEYAVVRTTASAAPLTAYDYLLITRTNLLASFQPLLDRKIADGLAVAAETVESITNSYPGADTPERIRNCIRNAYTNGGVEYVLLGGDVAVVPCRYAYVDVDLPLVDSLVPCDLYYACLDGSWNSDLDSRWGEPTDGEDGGDVDLLAEVIVGRAPVETVEEAARFVEKTLRYEVEGPPRAEDVLLTAEYLGYYPPGVHAQGGDMFDPMLATLSGHDLSWLDDRPSTTAQWTAAAAVAALNQSPHFALYAGHGDVDDVMRLAPGDLDAVTNAGLFLAYSVSCNAGEFDNDLFSPDCIGEEFVKRHSNGAFAAVFNSREGWFDPQEEWRYSGEFQIQFFDGLMTQGETNAGRAHQLAKHNLLALVETNAAIMPYRWCYYGITLFGDPHLPVREAGCRVTVAGDSGGVLPGHMVLRWNTVSGRLYTLSWSAGPDGVYSNLAENLTVGIYTDALHAAEQRGFYRVVWQP